MRKHVRERCKIANTEEGHNLLFEHVMARQEKGVVVEGDHSAAQVGDHNTLVMGNQINNNIQVNINVRPFDGPEPIRLTPDILKRALAECPDLVKFGQLSEREMFEEEGMKLVSNGIMDVVRRAHLDPEGLNIMMSNEHRDQALVYTSENGWVARPIDEAGIDLVSKMAPPLMRESNTCAYPIPEWSSIGGMHLACVSYPGDIYRNGRSRLIDHLIGQNLRLVAACKSGEPPVAPIELAALKSALASTASQDPAGDEPLSIARTGSESARGEIDEVDALFAEIEAV
jgi:hypothetical protein